MHSALVCVVRMSMHARAQVCELRLDADSALPIKQLSGTEPTTSIDLSARQLGAGSAAVVATLIRANRTLLHLSLPGNVLVGPLGGEALAAAVQDNSCLLSLDLFGCRIGDRGARALAAALRVNATLRSLDVQMNHIDELAIAELLTIARHRRSGLEIAHDAQWMSGHAPQRRSAPQRASRGRGNSRHKQGRAEQRQYAANKATLANVLRSSLYFKVRPVRVVASPH